MNVQLVRLRSGELILADTDKSHGGYVLKNPVSMTMTGPNQMALVPWMQIADFDRKAGFTFSPEQVEYVLPPAQNIKEKYIESVTGIQVAAPQLLQENSDSVVSASEMMGGKLRLT